MPAPVFPSHLLNVLTDLGTRVIDSRKAGTDREVLARDLLGGFFDICRRWGLDRVLVELEVSERNGLTDHSILLPALVAQLGTFDLDDGGPRNAKPRQLADALVAALGLVVTDEPDRTIALDDGVRIKVIAALASVVDVELGMPQIRDTIIAKARERCEPQFLGSFEKIVAQLDERGLRMIKQPKVPLDASQSIQQVLTETRDALVDRVGRAAIDRAKEVIAGANADAAARIDLPVSLRLTVRDVAILRASEARVAKVPPAIVGALLEGLTEVSGIAWRGPERPVRPYAASQKFVVGDLIEHPKFGRGSVVTSLGARIEVEFADGKHTLAQAK